MTRITRSADCGNSPKNKLVEELAIAIETGAPEASSLADDLRWDRADGTALSGRDAVTAAMAAVAAPEEIVIERIASHGKVGSALGRSGSKTFAHFFEFASAAAKTVARIESFSKTEQ